jgi:hypothetical protein
VRALAIVALCSLALTAAACGETRVEGKAKAAAPGPAQPRCSKAQLRGWQRLADRIGAPVYCPSWLPDPLDGVIGSRWNNIDEVSKDRSYLESWVWQETGPGAAGGELHVNLRGYPGRVRIPRCPAESGGGTIPCYADPHGVVRRNGITATVYTVNQGADQWHVLYAWRFRGSLYTLSEHVAPPVDYRKVRLYLNRELAGLQLVQPTA